MDSKLENLTSKIWGSIDKGAQIIESESKYIIYNKGSEKRYKQIFEDLYKYIATQYMENPEEALDRHKVAAISMIAVIKADVVESNKQDDDEVFFGNYTLATDCGLRYMLSELNKRLEKEGEAPIQGYYFPTAMACETDYYRIFYRNLYFAYNNDEWGLNPLDIAERLFLLEYMTLEKNGIDPCILKEY